jgi:quercetin dioxygenase-like cupin family protein
VAYPGQVIYNPLTHERFTFIRTTDQTGGDSLLFSCRVSPGGARLMPHVHQTQEERFRVKAGTLGVMLGGKKHTLTAGEGIILPARIKHAWWNAGDDDVEFLVEVLPARNLEATLESLATMAEAGKLNKKAMPKNPFLLAALGQFSETYLPGVPIWMQKVGLKMGTTMGRAFGIDPTLTNFRTGESSAIAMAQAEEYAA